jgi:hypothetical protein
MPQAGERSTFASVRVLSYAEPCLPFRTIGQGQYLHRSKSTYCFPSDYERISLRDRDVLSVKQENKLDMMDPTEVRVTTGTRK